jgi:radical SAM superfamily enzyme YgiQ (UPF0313 family)
MKGKKMEKVAILNLPSPPGLDVYRDTAGAYGTAQSVRRREYGHSSNVFFPTFVPYLATKLKREGYQVTFVDGQAERCTLARFVARVEREAPEVVITMLSLPSLWGDCDVLMALRRKLPTTPLIGIGPVCVPLAREVLDRSGIDLLVKGAYPFYHAPILEFLRQLRTKSLQHAREVPGAIFSDETRSANRLVDLPVQADGRDESLDDLDVEVYRRLPMHKYRLAAMGPGGRLTNYFPILGGKGCPFCCMYCPYPPGYGKRLVLKSPSLVVNEMEFLHRNFGIDAFLFRDQLFTADRRRVETICHSMLARNLDVSWAVEARVDEVSRSMLNVMSRAGCIRIQYGVETGDAALLEKVGKPGLVMERIREGFEHTVREGIFAVAFVLFGLPGEDMAAAGRTIDFALRLNCDNVLCSVVTPYPGTKLFDLARQKRLILTYDWKRYTSRHIVMRTEELSARDLARVRARFMVLFRAKQVGRMLRRPRTRTGSALSWRGAAYRFRMAKEHCLGRRA